MKKQLFSVLMLMVTVLFVSAVQPVEASADYDQVSIEQIVSIDSPISIDLSQEFQSVDQVAHYTSMEVCSNVPSYEADIDHQIITVRAPVNRHELTYREYKQYLPRSNLINSDYLP